MTIRSVLLSLICILPAADAFVSTYFKSACHHSLVKSNHRNNLLNQLSSTIVPNTEIRHVDDYDVDGGIAHHRRHAPPSSTLRNLILSTTISANIILFGASVPASAVSGGGLDYAGLDITGRDFSNGDYKGKDFTQTIAKGATFAKSNLQGCRFYKAYLVNTNFEGADARGASFEDTSMDNANLRNIDARGSYFGQSLLDVQSLEGGDFTDAQIPVKTLKLVCDRDDVKGTNPTTGADTRDSLMCL